MADINRDLDGLTPVNDEPETSVDASTEAELYSEDAANSAGKGPSDGKKKKKQPWSKKKKVVFGVCMGVVAAILIAVIVVVCVLFTGKAQAVGFDKTPVNLDMGLYGEYYAGSEGDYDTSLVPSDITPTVVDGGVNVSNYADFLKAVKDGKTVVIHSREVFNLTEQIKLKGSVYGNGVSINAYEVIKGTVDVTGTAGIVINEESSNDPANPIIFRDVKLYGQELTPEITDIKTFNGYGDLLYINGSATEKACAEIIHCVIENSHKVVHMSGAIVSMENCVVRNASDTAISIGTFDKKSVKFYSKDNIVASSLTGGILSYCYDSVTDSDATWNKIYIEGFLHNYNWKKVSELAFLPDTELKGGLAGLVPTINSTLSKTVQEDEYSKMRVDADDDIFVHFGILQIATGGNKANKAKIYYDNKEITSNTENGLGYSSEEFPIPAIGKAFLKQLRLTGYFNNDKEIGHNETISDHAEEYKEIGIVVG